MKQDLSSSLDDDDECSEPDANDVLTTNRWTSRNMVLRLITLLAGEKLAVWVHEFLESGNMVNGHNSVCESQ